MDFIVPPWIASLGLESNATVEQGEAAGKVLVHSSANQV